MRKLIGIVFSLSVILMLLLCVSVSAPKTIDELMVPYQAAIDKVNADLGSTAFIPDGTKEEVYNNIKDKSPYEFEALLRQEYETSVLDPAKSDTNISVGKEGSGLVPIPNSTGPIHLTPL